MPVPLIETNLTPSHNRTRRTMFWISVFLGAVLLVGLLLIVGGLLLTVDDWNRDLRENRAGTSEDAADPQLRPVKTRSSMEDLAACVIGAAARLPDWQLVAEERESETIVLRLVHSTRVWRFQDDIVVTIRPRDEGTGGASLQAESRSRIGRGDLGQNPRNLRQLLRAVRDCIGADGHVS
ncbi:MAG: DUF1499 domain-containing protein [Planctomycetes bacterium]|nr:DUF1499 domain-containing protein [Planctomycetota bacterium]